ncbi:MAG: hypothetical protein QXH30_01325 [Candidatus Bilamarchaeaceae archaeon]
MNSNGSVSGTGRMPPILQPTSLRAPPPILERNAGGGQADVTDPSVRTTEYRQAALLQLLQSFYPEDRGRLHLNGNGRPVLQAHLQYAKESVIIKVESDTKYLFFLPVKFVAAAATALALASGGLAIRSCMSASDAREQIEVQKKDIQDLKRQLRQEKPKTGPKSLSLYIPKALRNPPQAPNRIPQRIARNSLRA